MVVGLVTGVWKEEELACNLAYLASEFLWHFLEPFSSLPCLTSDHPQGILQR